MYAYTNELDAAFEWLERHLDAGKSPGGGWFAPVRDPYFSNLHADPRWEAILERLGVAPAQLEVLDFQVTLPDYISGEQDRA